MKSNMTTWAPQPFKWNGEAMVPLRPRLADKLFVIGQDYILEETEERSTPAHRAYMASVNEVWKSLPEDLAETFPTATALRKSALIATGWRDEVTEVFRSNAEARRAAELVRKFSPPDAYPKIVVSGCILLVLTAKSQAYRAMRREDFTASSQAVLDYLANLLGVEPAALPQTEAA